MKIDLPKTLDLALIVRGIAALIVVYWHLIGAYQEKSIFDFFNIPGRVAVWLFFVFSGYLIAYAFISQKYKFTNLDLKKFYFNRLLRVYPLFLCTSLVSLALTIYFNNPFEFSLRFLLEQIFAVQWTHNYSLSGVFWTLGIEMQFYLIAPFFLLYQITSANPLKTGLWIYLFLLFIPHVSHFGFSSSWDNRTLLGNLAHFQIGVLGCLARDQIINKIKENTFKISLISSCIAIVSLFFCAGLYHMSKFFWVGPGAVLLHFSGIMFIISHTILEHGKIPLNLVTKLLAYLGVLSYGLYAWHSILAQYFKIFETSLTLNLVCSLLLATITYFAIERPALMLKCK